MPLTRIDVTDSIDSDRLGALADALHQAAVETIGITPGSALTQRPARCVLRRPVRPSFPICAVNMASAVTLGNWDCPDQPRKPNPPR
jgi:hypothetical protein